MSYNGESQRPQLANNAEDENSNSGKGDTPQGTGSDLGHSEVQHVFEHSAMLIQRCARRMLAKTKIRTQRARINQRSETLDALRSMYVDVWQIPDTIPPDAHEKLMTRLVERDILDTQNGAPELNDETLKTLNKQKKTLESMTLDDRLIMMKDKRNLPVERAVVALMLTVDAHEKERLKAAEELRLAKARAAMSIVITAKSIEAARLQTIKKKASAKAARQRMHEAAAAAKIEGTLAVRKQLRVREVVDDARAKATADAKFDERVQYLLSLTSDNSDQCEKDDHESRHETPERWAYQLSPRSPKGHGEARRRAAELSWRRHYREKEAYQVFKEECEHKLFQAEISRMRAAARVRRVRSKQAAKALAGAATVKQERTKYAQRSQRRLSLNSYIVFDGDRHG